MTAKILKKKLKAKANASNVSTLKYFFKTGPGQYGEGDQFIGVKMPDLRMIAKEAILCPHNEILELLNSPIHEERMLGLVIVAMKFEQARKTQNFAAMKKNYGFYLKNRKAINNWDLVDVTAPTVVGGFLYEGDRSILTEFALSKNLWERRIAIISTHYFIRKNDFQDTLRLAKILLNDSHDLIHKATGWMLREVGKRDQKALTKFLDTHGKKMPRTMLRYSIEKLPEKLRKKYLHAPIK